MRLDCSNLVAGGGRNAVRTLATANGEAYAEIGYDLTRQILYADHTRCCALQNHIVQTVPLPFSRLNGSISITIVVDGGLIETFGAGLALTVLVDPDVAVAPRARVTTVQNMT